MSGVNRLNRRRWAHARLAVLERDGWRCVTCGRAGRLEVDHVQALDQGGKPYELANLQTLCRPCHFDKTWEEQASPERRRWREIAREIDRDFTQSLD